MPIPMKRFLLTFVLPCLLVILWVVLPLIRGTETLFLRDVFNTHLGKKWVQAESMRDGVLPVVDTYRDGGEPHLGNPNTVPLYPDNLLYLLAPTLWAFNAHYWLHLLMAPLAMFWLGRVWGLSRESAWAAGVCYAASGFLVSNLGFYNLIAGAAWTPAFVAALLHVARPASDRRSLLPLGLIWTLLLLAGDPMTCVMALFLGASAVILRWGWRQTNWVPLGVALALGTVIASPQWVEFLRILPLSYRGHMGFSEAGATAASWHPLAVVEWWIPFFFGRPDVTFWGQDFHGGNLPLFSSLYPGVLALILVLGSGRPSGRASQWAWSVAGVGALLALGEHNFLVGWLLKIPGTDLMRLPVKFWLMTAVGLSLLCGLGFERLMAESGRRAFWRILAGLSLVFLLLWLVLGGSGGQSPSWLTTKIAGTAGTERLVLEQTAWAGWALISLGLLLLMGLIYRFGVYRFPQVAAAGLLVLHLMVQFWILRPVYPMAEVDRLLEPPTLLDFVPEDAVVTHGKSNGLFGATEVTLADYPDARPVWLQRQVIDELYPVAGTIFGRRYDFNISAEGLDAFLTRATAEALRILPDVKRLRLLAASGVNVLILGRLLETETSDLARLLHRQSGVGGDIFVYELEAVPPVLFLGKVLRAPHLNAALDWITAPEFDLTTSVVLPEGGSSLDGPPGRVKIIESGSQHMEMQVSSAAPGVLVLQRAFLPIYKATANGKKMPIVAANIHRLGLELPAGDHRVEVWIDRRPLWISMILAGIALVLLVALSRLRQRR